MVEVATHLLKAHARCHIDVIGLAVAGTVRRRVLTWSSNLGMEAVDFQAELQATTGHATTVINDARAAALGEAHLGAGVDAVTVLMITVGTGIGGGIVVGDRLYTGTDHAGEVGHIIVDPRGPSCRCGNTGCWEQMASGRSLEAAARKTAREQPNGRIAACAAGGQPNAATLAEAADRGDTIAIRIIRQHATYFARGLDTLCAVLAPHLLILGGGIIARPGPIRKAYVSASRKLRWHRGQTRTAMLGDNAGLIGATLAARHEHSAMNAEESG